MTRNAGRSLLALGAVLLLQYRRVLTGKIKNKLLEVIGTASFLMQWAFANMVLSAQSALTDKVRLFFQACLSHFEGQLVSMTVAEPTAVEWPSRFRGKSGGDDSSHAPGDSFVHPYAQVGSWFTIGNSHGLVRPPPPYVCLRYACEASVFMLSRDMSGISQK